MQFWDLMKTFNKSKFQEIKMKFKYLIYKIINLYYKQILYLIKKYSNSKLNKMKIMKLNHRKHIFYYFKMN